MLEEGQTAVMLEEGVCRGHLEKLEEHWCGHNMLQICAAQRLLADPKTTNLSRTLVKMSCEPHMRGSVDKG